MDFVPACEFSTAARLLALLHPVHSQPVPPPCYEHGKVYICKSLFEMSLFRLALAKVLVSWRSISKAAGSLAVATVNL